MGIPKLVELAVSHLGRCLVQRQWCIAHVVESRVLRGPVELAEYTPTLLRGFYGVGPRTQHTLQSLLGVGGYFWWMLFGTALVSTSWWC